MATRDAQVKRVYDWETSWPSWNRKSLNKQECESLVKVACGWYSVPPPPIHIFRKTRGSTYYAPWEHSIHFRKRHMNMAVVLHETAHAIHSYLLGDDAHQIHGQEFMGIYLWLLWKCQLASPEALVLSAKAYGIKWRPLTWLSPSKIRKKYKRLYKSTNYWRKIME